ncbi:cobalt-precorrin-6A synthase [Fulvimarina pelagi HTCC2506]|uniref:Cobalt-precorrin-5B C(1)-methyltransferase n=1 Tax=Fulvimarina pelagi HTCC2506 TaxID=314231 RepID=Q0G1Y3_9HYPH|nr:cobalt-precorrin-5B (C(1))-methyltransferase [Fulvimarina pelagi]EAU41415.1 cobalt-precorrin-6A synthase [Fulvimarina pelagi HTCC2506]
MSEANEETQRKDATTGLRRGWTTGACATAATKAALTALLTGTFPDPVTIRLPKGENPSFALCRQTLSGRSAMASIVKDAGDDPDVTHLAEIVVTVTLIESAPGLVFRAGKGVGTVTREGLPIGVGEPAINPVPRAMMQAVVDDLLTAHEISDGVEITVSIPDGERLAEKTWNPRLGIVGGLSILGTTGIVHPFSCASWIHAIHRGVDVARAAGIKHLVGPTGSASEAAARLVYPELPEFAFLDMGDFAGGLIKYLRTHPVERLTIAGGFGKLTKLAQGAMDLHSGRSQVDFAFLKNLTEAAGQTKLAETIGAANSAGHALALATAQDFDLARHVALAAKRTAERLCLGIPIAIDVIVVDRAGTVIAHVQ